MIIIVLLLLMFAVPATAYMFLSCATGIVEWLTKERPPPPKPRVARAHLPELKVDGPEWWWRWQRTEQWHSDHQPEPAKVRLAPQPVPKKARPIAQTWEEMGHKVGVVNLETGEVYEPATEESHG